VSNFRIGCFEVQPRYNKIVSSKEEVRLEPKIMQVLEFLVLHKGEVLTREQIISALWPNQVVGNEVITRAIFELRKHFNDDPKHPKFIETIPRKGYCFVHDFEVIEQPTKRGRQNKLGSLALATALTILFLFVQYKFISENNGDESRKNAEATTVLLEDSEYKISSPRLSPQQSQVIYVTRQNDFSGLTLINTESLQKTVLIQSKNLIRSPRWKSEQAIVYISCNDEYCDVINRDLEENKQTQLLRTQSRLTSLDIHADRLIANSGDSNGTYVHVFSLKNGQLVEDVKLTSSSARSPVFGIDGSSIFYVANDNNEHPIIHQWSSTQQKVIQSVDVFNRVFDFVEVTAKRLLVAGRKNGKTGIWQVSLPENDAVLVSPSPIGEFMLSVDANGFGSNLISGSILRNIDVFATTDIPVIQQLNGNMIDMNAIWDPTTKTGYFVSNRSGRFEIWRADESGTRKITSLNTNLMNRPVLSKDKSQLAFVSPLHSTSQINIVDIDGINPVKITEIPGDVQLLAWSFDNQSLFYSAYDQGKYHIFKFSISKQNAEPIIVSAGFMLHEDKEAGELYYIEPQERRLMKVTNNGEIQQLSNTLKDSRRLRPLQAVMYKGNLYYIAFQNQLPALVKYNLDTRIYETLEVLPQDAYVTQILIDENQQTVIYDITHPDRSRIYQSRF